MTPRHTSPVSTLLALTSSLLVMACGDDESSAAAPPESDAGIDAGTPRRGPVSSGRTDVGGDAAVSPTPAHCTHIAAACVGKDDEDGLANLCLRVGASNNAEECASLVGECAAFCGEGQLPKLDGGGPSEEACKAMGNTCHDFDEGSGLGHLCHEVGHTGNVAWCGAIFDECLELCGSPGGHGGPDASTDAAASQSLTIQFAANVGDRAFACGEEYANFGSKSSVVTPQDLRFYVSAVRLITPSGEQVPAVIDDAAPFQGGGVALLDFEDGTGECRNGSDVTNTAITVTAPAGEYTGIAFSTSVPEDLNHGDPLTLPAPLQAGDMTWGWLFGYKFIKAEFVQVLSAADARALGPVSEDAVSENTTSQNAVSPNSAALDAGSPDAGGPVMAGDAMAPMPGVGIFHLGSTGCTNLLGADAGANEFEVTCAKPAFNDVVLGNFNAETNVVTFDLARVFAEVDVSAMSMCHGMGESCPSLFASVGVDFETGATAATQTAFGIE